jgi:hypothetical protein
MKVLTIRWQRLVSQGRTCDRCGSTHGDSFEVIPERLIVKAALRAASAMLDDEGAPEGT